MMIGLMIPRPSYSASEFENNVRMHTQLDHKNHKDDLGIVPQHQTTVPLACNKLKTRNVKMDFDI